MKPLRKFFELIKTKIFDRFSILVVGLVIYAYYLFTSLPMITHRQSGRGFLEYVFQFDSLIILWVLAFVWFQMQKYRQKHKEEEKEKEKIIQAYERQRIEVDVVDEITTVLNDAVNNPLAIISLSSSSIREKFAADRDILDYLDRIDGALKRIADIINDFKAHQITKIVKARKSEPAGHMSPDKTPPAGDRFVQSAHAFSALPPV